MAVDPKRAVRCGICPKRCRIPAGGSGECRARVNRDGTLRAATYGRPCAVHVDPMEKKPLYHFFPGEPVLSVGAAGCNLHCRNCQNADISQASPEDVPAYELEPGEVVALARRHGCGHVAYTYNEPLVGYEYVRDCCGVAREAGLRNVLVTCGYVNERPLAALLPLVDAVNIDLKGFSEAFYAEVCGGSLAPVLRAAKMMAAAGVHVEVTNLVIPTLNDSDEMLDGLCGWVCGELGPETPVHFSRFFPAFRMAHLPPTPAGTLARTRERARAAGLRHVYVGNLEVPDGEVTFCASCGERVIVRQRYVVKENRLLPGGRCAGCGAAANVIGEWRLANGDL